MKQTSTPRVNSPKCKLIRFIGLLILVCCLSCFQAISQSCTSTISSNFNGTAIPAGRYIWFNAHFKVNGLTTSPTTIDIDNGSITFSANGTNYNLAVPRSTVTFSNSNTTSSYIFDNATQRWIINVPFNVNNNVFFAGLTVVSPGFPGGINPVNYTTTFTSSQPGITIDWQWSAAVYTTFSTDYNQLGVTIVDGAGAHAGSPENYNGYAVGGARGGGAANTTGSWSATGHAVPCACNGGSVEGMIWNDQTPDGIHQSSEPGIANVTVKLYNSANTVIGTTTTNTTGHYIFNNIPNQTGLKIGVTKLLGYDFTQQNAPGSSSNNNSDINPTTGKTNTFDLANCQHLDFDAGLICNICIPLAVTLGQLQASNQNGIVVLGWNTSSEVNSGVFEIQRSSNGIDFSTIGIVNAIGNSTNRLNYIFKDRLPSAGVNYYKIKAIDAFAQRFAFSNIATINVQFKGFSINSVTPNPFTDQLRITIVSESSEQYTVKFFDAIGRVVGSHTGTSLPGITQVDMNDLSKLQKGIYIVDVRSKTSSAHMQVVRQ